MKVPLSVVKESHFTTINKSSFFCKRPNRQMEGSRLPPGSPDKNERGGAFLGSAHASAWGPSMEGRPKSFGVRPQLVTTFAR